METQTIVNLLNDSDNESPKFATRKWYTINDQNNGQYGEGNENDSTIKFETKVIKSNLCDYSDAYILVTGNITATGGDENTKVTFKNWSPFTRYVTHINDKLIETAENLDVIMPMYNLLWDPYVSPGCTIRLAFFWVFLLCFSMLILSLPLLGLRSKSTSLSPGFCVRRPRQYDTIC